jgi:hypothetical protein
MTEKPNTKTNPDATKVLTKVSEVMTEKPVSISFSIKPKNKFEEWLMKRNLKPSKRFYEIRPQRVVNIYRIAGRAVTFNVAGIFDNTDTVGTIMKVMAEHGDDIFYIVAAAIQNNHAEPSKSLIKIIKNEFEMDDILKVLKVAIGNYNISDFMTSIALITGIDALNAKSQNQASPAANGG